MVRLLVIDDVTDARALVRVALGRFGRYEVVAEAEDAESGIELAERHQPDGVILDILLPGMSGTEAITPLLAAVPATRIIVWSSTAPATGAQALEAGAVAVVDKLDGVEALIAVLDSVFEPT